MRELHTSTHLSLDGFHDDSYSLVREYQQDAEFARYSDEMLGGHDTLISGRKTYQAYRRYQNASDAAPSQETMSAHAHVVFSNTLTDEEVGDAVRYRGDLIGNVKALKEQPGRDLMLLGSPSLRTQLLNAGLIDRLKIWHFPITLGSGTSVFEGVTKTIRFKLMRSYTFHHGIIRAEYQVLKPDAED